jgi:hypothetical protein
MSAHFVDFIACYSQIFPFYIIQSSVLTSIRFEMHLSIKITRDFFFWLMTPASITSPCNIFNIQHITLLKKKCEKDEVLLISMANIDE